MTKKVVVVPGDESMPEAILPVVDILRSMKLDLNIQVLPTGPESLKKTDAELAKEVESAFKGADASFRGSTAEHLKGRGSTRHMMSFRHTEKPLICQVRATKWLKGFNSPLKHPEGIDYLMVREGQEDVYRGIQGPLTDLAPLKLKEGRSGATLDTVNFHGGYLIKIITRERTLQTAEFGCQLALKRKKRGYPGKVTIVSKARIFPTTDGLFRQVCEETAAKYPELSYEWLSPDNFSNQMILNPRGLDVIIITNQFGDILSDAAGATIGGIGLCPSGVYGDDFASFAPIHGTAPDLFGKNIINPTSFIFAAKMMLEYLDMQKDANRLESALAKVYKNGKILTPDQGGKATTTEFCEAVKRNL